MHSASLLVVILIAAGTLAFGAVYPWAYLPLFAAAAAMGVWGIRRAGLPARLRPLATALLILWVLTAAQLVPLPRELVAVLSPAAPAVADSYNLRVAGVPDAALPLSIDPSRTQIAVLALGALGLYLLGMPAQVGREGLRRLPTAFAVFSLPLALFGIYNWEHTNHLVYWFWEPLDQSRTVVFGPFIHRNHYGGWMLMILCLQVGWLIGRIERGWSTRTRARHSRRRLAWLSSPETSGIVLMACAVLVGTVSLFWTLSRSSMLSLAAATALFGWLVVRRRHLGRVRRGAVLAAVSAVLLAGITWRGPARLLEWFQENNLASRLDAWRDGWDVIRAFPWTGSGLNTYPVAMLFYQSRNRDYFMNAAHNDYVQLAAEGGIVVMAAAVIAAAVLATAIRRNVRAAYHESRGYWIRAGAAVGLLAIGVQETLEFSLQVPVNALLFCTLAAIALAPVSARDTITVRKEG